MDDDPTNDDQDDNASREHDASMDASARTDSRQTPFQSQTASNSVSPNQQQLEEEDDALMVCRCDTPKLLVDLLQAFSKTGLQKGKITTNGTAMMTAATQNPTPKNSATPLQNNIPMSIFCAPQGITFHQQSSNKQFQASMELPATFFGHYEIKGGEENGTEQFTIHWNTLLQCLGVLLTTSSGHTNHFHPYFNPTGVTQHSTLTMAYHTSTELLRLEWETTTTSAAAAAATDTMENHPILATAAIPGLIPPDAGEAAELSSAFASSKILARWLSPSHRLKECKSELEHVPGATMVQITFFHEGDYDDDDDYVADALAAPTQPPSSQPPLLRFMTKGHSSQVVVDVPGPIEFADDVSNKRLSFTYSLQHWKQSMSPLDVAQETCLSVNEQGIFAVQHQLSIKKGNPDPDKDNLAFCDFLLLPMVEQLTEDEESDDSDDGNNEEEPSSDEESDSDDDEEETQSATAAARIRTRQSTKRKSHDDDHYSIMTTQSQESQQRARRRRGKSEDDTDDDGSHSARLPIGSDDDDDDEEDEERHRRTLEERKKSGMLFPKLDQGGSNNPRGSPSQASTLSEYQEASTIRHQRRRDERKRQRRASMELRQQQQRQQEQHQRESSGQDETQEEQPSDDHGSTGARSPNLLADTPESTQSHRPTYLDDDEDYPSSPEIVYGEG
jgi:hypothetical protein